MYAMKEKMKWPIIALLALSGGAFGQEISLSLGGQVTQGEVSEYDQTPTFSTSVQYLQNVYANPYFKYGVELRYTTMNMSPSIDEGWLDSYEMRGSDVNLMMKIRYHFNAPKNTKAPRGSWVTYGQFGAGVHFMSFRTTDPMGRVSESANKSADLSDTERQHAGALELGLGVKYYLTNTWTLAFNVSGQYTGNDYLDGVAGIGDAEDWPFFGGLAVGYRL